MWKSVNDYVSVCVGIQMPDRDAEGAVVRLRPRYSISITDGDTEYLTPLIYFEIRLPKGLWRGRLSNLGPKDALGSILILARSRRCW